MKVMKKFKREKGFTLLELVITVAILLCSSSLFLSIISGNFKLIKMQDEISEENEVVNVVKNEIKYNINTCDIIDYFKDNSFMYLEIDNLINRIMNENILDIATNEFSNEKSIKISMDEVLDYEITLIFEIVDNKNEVLVNDIFEKKLWMENM